MATTDVETWLVGRAGDHLQDCGRSGAVRSTMTSASCRVTAAAPSLIYASPTMSLAAMSAGPRPHTRHVPSSSLTRVRNVTVVA